MPLAPSRLQNEKTDCVARSDTRIGSSPADSIAKAFLWPGDAAARVLGIPSRDGRMLFRLFVNLALYGKLGALLALLIF